MYSRWTFALSLLAAVVAKSDAFVAPKHTQLASPVTQSTALHMGPPIDPNAPITEKVGEGTRKYRRTVFTHDDWVQFRSSDRFAKNLKTLFNSGIYRSVAKEITATVTVATVVCLWNAIAGGYQGLGGEMHDPIIPGLMKIGLPMNTFTILNSSLGLLLVFRTNKSYGRWDEARKFWGLNINHTRDLCRMGTAWYGKMSEYDTTGFMDSASVDQTGIDPVKRQEDLQRLSLCTWAFVRSMKRHLSPPDEDEEAFQMELRSRLPADQAEKIIAAAHRPNRALQDLSVAIEKLPMHFVRKNELNKNLSIFEDTLGGCERLLSSPIPLFYSRHTARFLSSWLLLLPLALYGEFGNSWNHIAMIPTTGFISVCLFGIEELATQLEEPFTILPMQGFCDKIGRWCDEIVSWAGQGQGEDVVEVNTREMMKLPL
ncbi:hypothetical protein ACHAXS_012646 [Conticribra weissflogii]